MQGKHETKNRKHLQTFLESPRVHVIPVTEESAERYAVILKYLREYDNPIPTNDIWIAASAMEHGLELVSCDRDFLAVKQIMTHFVG